MTNPSTYAYVTLPLAAVAPGCERYVISSATASARSVGGERHSSSVALTSVAGEGTPANEQSSGVSSGN